MDCQEACAKEEWDKFWKSLKRVRWVLRKAIKVSYRWFKRDLEPELVKFLKQNSALVIKIVLEVAKYYADHPGHFKFNAAVNRLGRECAKELPNVQIFTDWLGLLVQIAVVALRVFGRR